MATLQLDLFQLNASGSNGQVLTTNGTSAYWANGGFSNGQSISVNNFVITGAFTANSSNGSSGQVLTSNGSGAYWAAGGGGGASANLIFGYNILYGG